MTLYSTILKTKVKSVDVLSWVGTCDQYIVYAGICKGKSVEYDVDKMLKSFFAAFRRLKGILTNSYNTKGVVIAVLKISLGFTGI